MRDKIIENFVYISFISDRANLLIKAHEIKNKMLENINN